MRLPTACLFILACLLTPICSAQDVYNQINVGTPPNGLFHGGEVDTVQTNNGNLHIEIPIWTVPGRGPIAPGDIFALDTKEWTNKITTDRQTGDTTAHIQPERYGTLGGSFGGLHSLTLTSQYHASTPTCLAYNSNFVIREANGTKHHLVPDPGDASCRSYTAYYADDGSGLVYIFGAPGTLLTKNGNTATSDTNGNSITGTQDTLGRPLVDGNTTYYDSAGNAQNPQVTFTSVKMNTHECQWIDPQPTFCVEYTLSINQIYQIKLPNGMVYTINYVQNDEGEPSSITLPSGAQSSWTYNPGVGGGPTVATRTVTANGTSSTWTYNYGGCPSCVSSIIDPLGNETDLTYTQLTAYPTNYGAYLPYVTTKQIKDKSSGSLVLVKTETTDYSTSIGPVFPIRVTTTWNQPNLVSKVETDYDSFSVSGISGLTFSAGNPIARREYDWGAGAPGNLLRRTAFNYLHLTNSAYLNANILDRVTGKWTYDSANNTCKGVSQACAQTTYSYDSTAITSTSSTPAPNHDYSGHGSTFTVRGNLTQTSRWLNTNSTLLNTTNTYDDLGNLRSTSDPAGNVTSYSYADNFTDGTNRNAQAFVTQITRPATAGVNHIEKKQFFWYTSLVAASCGQNFSSACANSYSPPQPDYAKFTYDNMFRPLTITRGDGGSTSVSYNDLTLPLSVTATTAITSSANEVTTAVFDDLYRQSRRMTANAEATPYDQVDTCYDVLGRVSFKSYPYQGSGLGTPKVCSGAGDSFNYDALARVLQVTHSDGTSALTSYTARATQVQDEGNGTHRVSRISQTDGLGRLSSLCEVSSTTLPVGSSPTPSACGQDIAATGFLTTYSYDPLDNLTGVSQTGLNSRSFTYDSLSRLLTATNPESGATTYKYDSDTSCASPNSFVGDLVSKVDARAARTCMRYDALHRLTQKNYSDGTPTATYNYDQSSANGVTLAHTVGRKSSESTAGSSPTGSVFSYDNMGRVIDNSQCTPQNCGTGVFSFKYTQYDFIGDLLAATNSAGVTFNYSYNVAARLTAMTTNFVDGSHPGTLFSNAHYGPFGMTSATVGNGITESLTYVPRGWLQSLTANSGSTTRYSFSVTTFAPNGDIRSANDTVNGNWTYTYDDFNRLLSASASGQSYTYDYDRFGNRWHQNGPHSSSLGFDANNRITGVTGITYDTSGDLTSDGSGTGSHKYFYDAENRIIQVDGTLGACSTATACYVYDAEGRRVRKTTNSGGSVDYLYDLAGHQASEVGPAGVFNRGELYAGNRHLATYTAGANGSTFFTHTDWLGTERARTDMTAAACETVSSLPFGDGQTISGTCGDVSPMHFTGKQRDSESGLDNFGARYDSSSMGRFMSPDPINLTARRLVIREHPEQVRLWREQSASLRRPRRSGHHRFLPTRTVWKSQGLRSHLHRCDEPADRKGQVPGFLSAGVQDRSQPEHDC
jgi:RHS repeat-associated protein